MIILNSYTPNISRCRKSKKKNGQLTLSARILQYAWRRCLLVKWNCFRKQSDVVEPYYQFSFVFFFCRTSRIGGWTKSFYCVIDDQLPTVLSSNACSNAGNLLNASSVGANTVSEASGLSRAPLRPARLMALVRVFSRLSLEIASYNDFVGGRRTVGMTWMTPLQAPIFDALMQAPLTEWTFRRIKVYVSSFDLCSDYVTTSEHSSLT